MDEATTPQSLGDLAASSLLQAAAALVVALVCWLIYRGLMRWRQRPVQGLGPWTGLRRSSRPWAELIALAPAMLLLGWGVAAMGSVIAPQLSELLPTTAPYKIAQMGGLGTVLVAALFYGFVMTGFSEELVFRGLIARRLMGWMGAGPGNLVQATLFALMHNGIIAALLPEADIGLHLYLGGSVFLMAFIAGWYMEIRDDGSIVGPWLIHGTGNAATILTHFFAISGG